MTQQGSPVIPRSTRVLAAIGLVTLLVVGVAAAIHVLADDSKAASPPRLILPTKPKR